VGIVREEDTIFFFRELAGDLRVFVLSLREKSTP
jgi:hypothetical protein